MKKLKLDLDGIRVASFPTETVREGRGTVNGHSVVVITSNTSVFSAGGSGSASIDSYCLPMLE